MWLADVIRHTREGSMMPLRIMFALAFIALLFAAFAIFQRREKLFGGRGTDRTTDSPAAGNLRMWMVILILIHAAAILALTAIGL